MELQPLHFFFFQAEDGIRDTSVTGVQTCALPIFAFPTVRQFSTATAVLWSRSLSGNSSSRATFERNVRLVGAVAAPNEPNIGRYKTGCGVGIDAFASPIRLHEIKPPLTIISGFTPKKAGRHKTRSATLPGSIEPTCCAIP